MKSVLYALIFSFLSFPAFAEHHGKKKPSFDDLDTNGDGVLSKDEVKGPLADHFDTIDVDGDGVITKDEMPEKPPRKKSY